MNLIELIAQNNQVKQWLEKSEPKSKQLITGVLGSAKTILMSSFYQEKKGKLLVIVPNLYYGNQLLDDFHHLLPEEELYFFPTDEVTAAEMSFSSPEALADRVRTLAFLTSNRSGIAIVPLAGVRKFLPTPDFWRASQLLLRVGEDLPVTDLAGKFIQMGYVRQSMVEKPGEFSIRGSIVDIYPLDLEHPVRIDLFDVEIDSIRSFEVDTQRSLENIDEVRIIPATDMIYTAENIDIGNRLMQEAAEKHMVAVKDEEAKSQFMSYMDSLFSEWNEGRVAGDTRRFNSFFYQEKISILDYLGEQDTVMIDDYPRVLETEKELIKDEADWIVQKLGENRIVPTVELAGDFRSILKKVQQAQTYFSLFQKGLGKIKFTQELAIQYRAMQQFFGQMPLLKVEMERWHKQKQTVILLVPNEERSKQMEEVLIDFNIHAVVNRSEDILLHETQICIGMLQNGFELPEAELVVLTEKEVLHTSTKKRAWRQTISNAERLKDYNELKPGDYVVHANHGIGQYIGMQTIEVDGVHKDYMTIMYQNDDQLFIPVTQLDLIQKYVAAESKTPRINKLGGSEWTKTKRKASKKIEDIADDLIQLYAEREAQKGFAFSPDTPYQQEFEDAFPYSETDDQLRSVAEIKKDMERERPMDRLLVGDVGYGKTEVALRAAFKAVQDGKQVAFLVPTTILAQQHYETMVDRFANFPVNVGLLSRFRTKKQQNETIEGLRKGTIDIVVGTHRLLSKDVVFHDLGLIIIDEEQRFGVKHKERLKQLRSQVDVLTLTATPIPRTLHMSMLGVRDLSVIETPPANRYPVQTYVMERNPMAIREAIEREMARDGQVFYLYNRVDTIVQKVEELQALVPDARIGFAHGQMTEVQLENVLFDFINGEYDVLVTTTIIETGVDIPNVNTLFVEMADRMGLSQLYQLRGRVGRSNRVAYAYFMYEPDKVLNEISEKRLQAIKDFTELGSGFKIAMRDLSIRGAGNLLGAQQHGFIDSVGFDMYAQMLAEAVAKKQGTGEKEAKTAVEIELAIDAYLPESYISDERQKIEIYKRIRQLESKEMLEELEADLIDRFGEYPDEVAHLLTVGELKMNGEFALIESIRRHGESVQVTLSKIGSHFYNVTDVFEALVATKLKADVSTDNKEKIVIKLKTDRLPEAVWLQEIVKFVSALRQQKYKEKAK